MPKDYEDLSSDEINELPGDQRRVAIRQKHANWNKSDDPDFWSGTCFVATACYGEGDVLNKLRGWRDKQKSGIGKKFVDFYYQGIGKKSASILNRFPILKVPAKFLIWLFMKIFV